MTTAATADTINQATADPVPSMPNPLSTSIELLRGLGEKDATTGTEKWHTVAEVRELTGEDEEYLASMGNKKGVTYTEYMNTILDRAVVKIGDLVVADLPGIMNKLILADRDMLFLGVVRATYGISREFRMICPHCSTSNDVAIDLDDDFPIKQPTFDLRETIKVDTRRGIVQLRLPNGEDTIFAQKHSDSDPALNTAMLARCAVWDEGKAPADTLEWARKLNVADRQKLVNALLDVEIGPDLEGVDTQCASCGGDLPVNLDWVSLLLS